jgi:hypothetical protein
LSRDGDGPVVGQFFGRPALPVGTEWPHGMVHLATVDLAAVPAGSHDLNLPPGGRLLFFAEPDLTPDDCTVVYVPAGIAVSEREVPEDFSVPVFDPFPLYGTSQWTVPRERWEIPTDAGEPVHDEDAIAAVMWGVGFGDCQLAIGGYGDESTSGAGNPVGEGKNETVLAHVYLTDDLGIGETFGGSPLCLLTYLMTYDDLAARRFDKAWHFSDFNG